VSILDFIWLFFLFVTFTPLIQQRLLDAQRLRLLQRLEARRGARVILLIHRQESISLLGIPLARYLDIEDSEQVLRAIHLTPPDVPIDLIVHTPGGLVLAAEQIASALCRHRGKVTVFVPHYAMSGGTLIALAADEIVLDPNAVLGPVDPQVGEFPAASLLEVVRAKPIEQIDDRTLILADVAAKALRQARATVVEILMANGMSAERADAIAEVLSSGRWTHDYPISVAEAQALGLPVSTNLPAEVYELMSLYRQPVNRRPSVEYVPLPFHHPDRARPSRTLDLGGDSRG